MICTYTMKTSPQVRDGFIGVFSELRIGEYFLLESDPIRLDYIRCSPYWRKKSESKYGVYLKGKFEGSTYTDLRGNTKIKLRVIDPRKAGYSL